jgi:hypothetical protein
MFTALLALVLVGQETSAQPAREKLSEDRCIRTVRDAKGVVVEGLRFRVCTEWGPEREFEGLWIDEFEGQRFLEGASSLSDVGEGRRAVNIWFSTDAQTRFPASFDRSRSRGKFRTVYRVKFRGRATPVIERPSVLEGYGHLGVSNGEVLAREVLAIEALPEGPPA